VLSGVWGCVLRYMVSRGVFAGAYSQALSGLTGLRYEGSRCRQLSSFECYRCSILVICIDRPADTMQSSACESTGGGSHLSQMVPGLGSARAKGSVFHPPVRALVLIS
jgi:hypothetical protein